ncbi:ankyrin repeat domain-containing protein [Endozoicomonas sp. SCSIO W0465]|uniref:ankyrin repeat domain-containing protein n=1 Tax=Endozoicomonas sp. SCSIO W0465 TaxID=2918516 RepID=UPI0020758900|nr:ankyrin repeat domain-containing protein [Endozoicomonas sp. SCSIO W0465]USE37240.1 ankyrin repeat domain-containing protein [Endozoicomonas sp. SCSIO W0465]
MEKKQSDKTDTASAPQIPRNDSGNMEKAKLSFSESTITAVVAPSKHNPHKAQLLTPKDPAQLSTTVEDINAHFLTFCSSDNGEELANLLSGMDEPSRRDWFSSSLACNDNKDTPLMYAARHGHVAVVKALIDYQANPCENNPSNPAQSNALVIAAQENHLEVIQAMANSKEFQPDKPGGDGLTAMFMAIKCGNAEVTKVLLQHNADPDYKIRCAIFEEKVEPTEIGSFEEGESIDKNVDEIRGIGDNEEGESTHKNIVKIKPIGGYGEGESIPSSQLWLTPVMQAVQSGNTIILEQLLSKGGTPNNIDPSNPKQLSPLQSAIMDLKDSSEEMVRLLLSFKANMYEKVVVTDDAVKKPAVLATLLDAAAYRAYARRNDTVARDVAWAMCEFSDDPLIKQLASIAKGKEIR